MSSAVTTTQLILNALHPNQTPSNWESDCVQAQVQWDDLVVRAIVFGLAPQLQQRLAGWGLELPARAAVKLKVTYQAQAQRNAAIYAQLGEVLEACAARQLQPIALKGVHLAACYYPDPALRPMNDIDLLFTPAELPAAEQLLADLGYSGKHKSADFGPGVTKHTSTFRRTGEEAATSNPYLSAAAGRTVEPHTSLEESWFGLKVDVTPGVRERSVTVALGGQPGRVLAVEDLLLHLCVHFCFHLIMGAPSIVQLADLLAVTRLDASGARLEWPLFVNRAIEQRAAPYALAALSLAHKLLQAPVPAEVTQALAQATPASLRRRIERLDLATILQRTQQKPLTTVGRRLWRGLSDRAETARWATDWRGRWQVWRTALDAGRTDTGRLLLKRLTMSRQ
ncbi:MAG: nucleotidyltransferase family protein [Chloroflexi bacterium]|nr:nucleotidyltransferase family protein [Chloroflexota bacterium]MCI0579626.1 nucleotidyltransferase family protein [Chloroflexota bacterium]MCI0643569.1 nucleotidyltransferase family protein [Chloroflexota bacterium]MCI0726191.1 nucleotidyltransferase family protein [Chloroflexota bacterium]